MQFDNPVGTNGFEFLEFTTNNPTKLESQFHTLGFKHTASHNTHPIKLYQQGNIKFIINLTKSSMANEFANQHGASVCAMGFRVADAEFALAHAIKNGAKAFEPSHELNSYGVPAIYGVGNSLIYFIDDKNASVFTQTRFSPVTTVDTSENSAGLTYIDHVTHNLYRGNMSQWADFYTRIFNFREIRYFDIEGRVTGLKSKAMTSPCGKIRIPLNESSDDQSQIEEFLKEFHGEGIQHIALGTDDIYKSVTTLHHNGIEFLETPDTYYDLIEKRLPNHGESLSSLSQLRILIDGETIKSKRLLLQIFTQNMLGPVFFEIIQRKGDEGFGEGNFRALFESIELDQIRRGVIKLEE